MIGPRDFAFLNEQGCLDELGWDGAQRGKLWRYNQHYFDDLNARDAHQRLAWHTALLSDWVAKNPIGAGSGWEPYPISLRIVNWVKWAWAGNGLPTGCVQSLAVQTRWLSKRLEIHLLGNHLFANAKALVLAGLYFGGSEAKLWLDKGLMIIARELPEQVLPDGGNFERSPMYHAIFLEDVLDLLNAAQAWPDQVSAQVIAQWRTVGLRMLAWLQGMTHPDGQIALFNDAAFGIAPTLSELDAYARRVLGLDLMQSKFPRDGIYGSDAICAPMHLTQWPDSGYIRLESDDAVALLDVGPIGPDYLPGHAHADTLSFELSVFGQRVVVNGGTSRYGLGPERLRERQTLSHSTVEVDGQSSSEVWGGFRVARRARPFDLAVLEGPDLLMVACSHDGYKRLPGKPRHRRAWQMRVTEIEVTDSMSGRCAFAVARYILHPDVQVEQVAVSSFHLKLTNGERISVELTDGQGGLEPASYAPEFGKTLPTQCIAVNLQDGKAQVRFSWS